MLHKEEIWGKGILSQYSVEHIDRVEEALYDRFKRKRSIKKLEGIKIGFGKSLIVKMRRGKVSNQQK